MDRDLVRRWKQGHDLAAEREREEARATSLADRVAQTVVMMRSAEALDWKTTDQGEIDVVRARFARLHALLGARP